jgi:hypothetical protein
MSAEIRFHPRIFAGTAAILKREQRQHFGLDPGQDANPLVRCADCRHGVPYPGRGTACWCLCYGSERSRYLPRECAAFEAPPAAA